MSAIHPSVFAAMFRPAGPPLMRTVAFSLAVGTVAGAYVAQNYNIPNVKEFYMTYYTQFSSYEKENRKSVEGSR